MEKYNTNLSPPQQKNRKNIHYLDVPNKIKPIQSPTQYEEPQDFYMEVPQIFVPAKVPTVQQQHETPINTTITLTADNLMSKQKTPSKFVGVPWMPSQQQHKSTEKRSPLLKTPTKNATPTGISKDKTPSKNVSVSRLPTKQQHCKSTTKMHETKLLKTPTKNVNRFMDFLTPNKVHFDMKKTSPLPIKFDKHQANSGDKFLYVNTNRRGKSAKKAINVGEADENGTAQLNQLNNAFLENGYEMTDDENNTIDAAAVIGGNFFELTQENVERFSKMVTKKNRLSLVEEWQQKIKKNASRESLLPINQKEVDEFINRKMEEIDGSSSKQSAETVIAVHPQRSESDMADESFVTAIDEKNGVKTIMDKSLSEAQHLSDPDVVLQKWYEHKDNDVVFYEVISGSAKDHNETVISEHDLSSIHSASNDSGTHSDFTIPSEYGTEDLRKELKQFGDQPGPIIKSTKRLYLKRLTRYKRQQNRAQPNRNGVCSKYFYKDLDFCFVQMQILLIYSDYFYQKQSFRLNYKRHCMH